VRRGAWRRRAFSDVVGAVSGRAVWRKAELARALRRRPALRQRLTQRPARALRSGGPAPPPPRAPREDRLQVTRVPSGPCLTVRSYLTVRAALVNPGQIRDIAARAARLARSVPLHSPAPAVPPLRELNAHARRRLPRRARCRCRGTLGEAPRVLALQRRDLERPAPAPARFGQIWSNLVEPHHVSRLHRRRPQHPRPRAGRRRSHLSDYLIGNVTYVC